MALSAKLKDRIRSAITNKADADALIAAIESGANPQAASAAAIGVTTDLVGVDGTGSNAAPLIGTEARLDAIESKVDEIISKLKAASLMVSP